MANYQMEVIAEPKHGTASVLIPGASGPQIMITGAAEDSYICGGCNEIICRNVQRGQIINLVFKCFKCGSFNRLRGS